MSVIKFPEIKRYAHPLFGMVGGVGPFATKSVIESDIEAFDLFMDEQAERGMYPPLRPVVDEDRT